MVRQLVCGWARWGQATLACRWLWGVRGGEGTPAGFEGALPQLQDGAGPRGWGPPGFLGKHCWWRGHGVQPTFPSHWGAAGVGVSWLLGPLYTCAQLPLCGSGLCPHCSPGHGLFPELRSEVWGLLPRWCMWHGTPRMCLSPSTTFTNWPTSCQTPALSMTLWMSFLRAQVGLGDHGGSGEPHLFAAGRWGSVFISFPMTGTKYSTSTT